MKIAVYDEAKYGAALEHFMSRCADSGIVNNSSRKALKLDEMSETRGRFWITLQDEQIVSMSGCQYLPVLGDGCYRIGFRAATLPEFRGHANKNLSKRWTGNWEWQNVLPFQIRWARQQGARFMVITTNTPKNDVDPSGLMFRVDRMMKTFERRGDVTLLHENHYLYYAYQNVWQITPRMEEEFIGRIEQIESHCFVEHHND